MPGKRPSLVSASLWQMPQASTLIRTEPGPGSGIGRSTISQGALGRRTCATRIVGMAFSSCDLRCHFICILSFARRVDSYDAAGDHVKAQRALHSPITLPVG